MPSGLIIFDDLLTASNKSNPSISFKKKILSFEIVNFSLFTKSKVLKFFKKKSFVDLLKSSEENKTFLKFLLRKIINSLTFFNSQLSKFLKKVCL